jgi:hypothetical protein
VLTQRVLTQRMLTQRMLTQRTLTQRTLIQRTLTKRTLTKRTLTKRTLTERTLTERTLTERTLTKRTLTKLARGPVGDRRGSRLPASGRSSGNDRDGARGDLGETGVPHREQPIHPPRPALIGQAGDEAAELLR